MCLSTVYRGAKTPENIVMNNVQSIEVQPGQVLLTADASERTVSHMAAACEGIVPCRQMPLTSADLAMLTPKPAAVFGVTDEHLAQLCAKHLT